MDPNAIAEVTTQIWTRIEHNLTYHGFNDLKEDSKIDIFKEAMDVYQTQLINESKNRSTRGEGGGSIGPKAEKPKSDTQCRECGRQLTVGEKKYCDDTKKPYLCYSCSHK